MSSPSRSRQHRVCTHCAVPHLKVADQDEIDSQNGDRSDESRASYVTGATLTADGGLTQVGAFNSEVAAVAGGLKEEL